MSKDGSVLSKGGLVLSKDWLGLSKDWLVLSKDWLVLPKDWMNGSVFVSPCPGIRHAFISPSFFYPFLSYVLFCIACVCLCVREFCVLCFMYLLSSFFIALGCRHTCFPPHGALCFPQRFRNKAVFISSHLVLAFWRRPGGGLEITKKPPCISWCFFAWKGP